MKKMPYAIILFFQGFFSFCHLSPKTEQFIKDNDL